MISANLRKKLFYKALKKIVRKQIVNKVSTFVAFDEMLLSIKSDRANHILALRELAVEFNETDLNDDIYGSLIQFFRFDLLPVRTAYDTQSIVYALAWALQIVCQPSSKESFDEWKHLISDFFPRLSTLLPLNITERLPFNDDVLALVYDELYDLMPFSRSYIFRNYERQHNDREFLVFPVINKSPKKLLVIFSGNVGRKTYNRYSWYWDEKEEWQEDTVYLFLNDIGSHWYVGVAGSQDRVTYREIIISVMKEYNFTSNDVVTVGASMGGYGAILYAIDLNLRGAIAVHPQLCLQSALRYKESSWEESISACGSNFRNLSDEVFRYDHRPIIYLESGDYQADLAGFDDFLYALRKKESIVILRKTNNQTHQTENPTRQQIKDLLSFIESVNI